MAWGVLPPASLVREPLMGTCGAEKRESLIRKVDGGERTVSGS
jgi:hypothetical protein